AASRIRDLVRPASRRLFALVTAIARLTVDTRPAVCHQMMTNARNRQSIGSRVITGPIPLSFDVTEALPTEAAEGSRVIISGWLFLPDIIDERPVTMTLLAGGSYDKRYHHVEIAGHPGYSAAEHLAAQGMIVLLNDHLGVGESSRLPTQAKAT